MSIPTRSDPIIPLISCNQSDMATATFDLCASSHDDTFSYHVVAYKLLMSRYIGVPKLREQSVDPWPPELAAVVGVESARALVERLCNVVAGGVA